jgi:hypothetical protein
MSVSEQNSLTVTAVFSGLLMIGLISFSGCETPFNPLKENDELVFSMVGVLDVNADTQWVRVMPVGEQLLPLKPEPNGTEVRLVRESTGKVSVMNDSLFRFNQDTYVWNYWTDEPIHPNEYYTVIAESPDGEQSKVRVETPAIPPVPDVDFNERLERIYVNGELTDSLVVLESRYLIQPITETGCGEETEVVLSHMNQVVVRDQDQYYMTAENGVALWEALGVSAYIINRRAVVIITATHDWPNAASLTEEEIALPDVISNVENGTGVVAGIARQEIILTPRKPPCVPS